MTVWQQKILEEVEKCLEIMDGKLLIPTVELRDKLMEETGCKTSHAYEIILLAREAIGNRKPTSKMAIREEILEMMRAEYQEAINLKGAERIDAVVKIAHALIKAYNLGEDDGEAFNIAQYLEENEIVITTDPSCVGVKLTDKELKAMAAQRRKYLKEMLDVEDAESVEVTDNGEALE